MCCVDWLRQPNKPGETAIGVFALELGQFLPCLRDRSPRQQIIMRIQSCLYFTTKRRQGGPALVAMGAAKALDRTKATGVYRNQKGSAQGTGQHLMAGTDCFCAFRVEAQMSN